MDVTDAVQYASSTTTRINPRRPTQRVVVSLTTDATAAAPFGEPGTWNFDPGHAVTASLCAVARLGGGRRCETWLCWSTERLCPVAVKMARPGTAADPTTARRLAA